MDELSGSSISKSYLVLVRLEKFLTQPYHVAEVFLQVTQAFTYLLKRLYVASKVFYLVNTMTFHKRLRTP